MRSDKPGRVSRAYTGFNTGYLVVILLLLSVLASIGLNVGLQGITRAALVLLLYPSVVLFPLSLLRRQWKLAVALAFPLFSFLIIFAPYFVPRAQAAEENAPILTVLTLNVHKPNTPEASEAIADVIRNSNAEIVAVQELGPLPEENFGPLLADQYPYQILRTDENYPGSGQGILSKFPLENERYWKAGSPWNGNLRADIVFEGQDIAIYNLHPHPPIERGLQFRMASHANVIGEVVSLASQETDPVLIVGDFNMMPEFPSYQRITETYTDAYRSVGDVGFGFTHSQPLPLWRVDYIFYDDHFHGIDARVLPGSTATDHLPVLARLQLRDP